MENTYNPGKSWLNLIFMFALGILVVSVLYKVVPVMGLLAEDMKIGMAQAGSLMSAVSFAGLIFSIPAGAALTKLGPKKATFIALAIILVGDVIGTFTGNYYVMFFARLLEGIGFVFVGMLGPTIIAMLFPPEKRGLPNGLWATWNSLGIIVALQIAAPATASFGWKGMWYVSIIIIAICAVLCALVKMPNEPKKGDAGAARPPKIPISVGLKNPASWCLAIIMFCFVMGMQMFNNYCPTYLAGQFGIDPAVANNYASILNTVMIIVPLVMGALLGKIFKNYSLVLLIVSVLIGVAAVAEFLIPSASLIMAVIILIGICYGCVPPVVGCAAPEVCANPAMVGVIMGISIFGQKLGGVIGPIIVGGVVDATGKWTAVAGVMAVVAVLSILAGIGFLITKKKFDKSNHAEKEVTM